MKEYDEEMKMSNEPDIGRLHDELESILEDATKHNPKTGIDDVRFARWEGQSVLAENMKIF